MAGDEQKIAVDGGDDLGSSKRQARAPLAMRIILALVAVVLIAGASLGCVNLYAGSVYDDATALLNINLAAFEQDDADLDALAMSQRQTDAQFEEASGMGMFLLPRLRDSIEHNAAISRSLSEQIADTLAQQHGETDGSVEPELSEGGENGTNGTVGSDGLTDEQRKKVKELLDSNQQQNSTTPSPGTTPNDDDANGKPW